MIDPGKPECLATASPKIRKRIARFETFIANRVVPLERSLDGYEQHERLEPSGRLAGPFVAAKREVNRLSAEEGFYAAHLPEEMGGGGLTLSEMFHLQEYASRHGLSLVLDALGHLEGPSHNLSHLQPSVRERYLAPLVAGRAWQSAAVTEPQSGGSDLLAMQATAERIQSGWRLNAHKWLISYAPFAEFAQIYAVTDARAGSRSLTGFMVEADWPGFRRGDVNRTLIDDGVTGELHCEDLEVSEENVIGEVGEGLYAFLSWINWSRFRRGGHCVGLAWHCYDRAVEHAIKTHRYGEPLYNLQSIQFKVVDMYMDIMACRAFVLRCLEDADAEGRWWDLHPGKQIVRNASMVKLASEEMLFRVADATVQILGSMGLLQEVGIEGIFRVARNLRIPGGTSEVMRATIAKDLVPEDWRAGPYK